MPYLVNCLLEVNKDMVEILLALHVLLTKDSKVENLLCTVSFPKAGLFFSDDVLRLWIEPVKDDLQHDFAWMADEDDCSLVLTQLHVVGSVTTIDWVHGVGQSPVCQIL